MNKLCLLTNLSSSDIAAWAQAIVSSIAIIVGAIVVFWQTRRARLELSEREARKLDGLVYLLIHLKESALEARAEKKSLQRLPLGHPTEPSKRFQELADEIQRFPLEAALAPVQIDSLLTIRRVVKGMLPYVDSEPELDLNSDNERIFQEYAEVLDGRILLFQEEADRLMKGKQMRHAVPRNWKSYRDSRS